MSVGSSSPLTAAVAASLAQSRGTEIDRAQQAAAAHERRLRSEALADNAGGIAATDGEDNLTGDRDADGRLPWQTQTPEQNGDASARNGRSSRTAASEAPVQSGLRLDVTV
ncbi:MAG TPA: hypothetical protein VGJ26_20080 [Pirellulales bacterium]|jgi:hypothetical protein